MVDPLKALIFVIVFLVLQQIEGNLIYPKVVGASVGLPSIWVLAAVTIGGNVMGVVGMLIFIPIVSVVYTLFRTSVYKRLKSKRRDLRTGAVIAEKPGESLRKAKNKFKTLTYIHPPWYTTTANGSRSFFYA